jgi:hypothetical protein
MEIFIWTARPQFDAGRVPMPAVLKNNQLQNDGPPQYLGAPHSRARPGEWHFYGATIDLNWPGTP